jgi:peptide/nickel transport system permease protein
VTYDIEQLGEALYRITVGDTEVGFAAVALTQGIGDYRLSLAALTAYSNGADSFSLEGKRYLLDLQGQLTLEGAVVGHISPLILQASQPVSDAFRSTVEQAIALEEPEFSWDGKDFSLHYDPAADQWSVGQQLSTRVWDSYAPPSRQHLLGTDKNGMDVLTRLMYGGRVSLLVGFLVVLIAGSLGMLLGGIAGYFGGITDELVMRLVDIFYCIPTTPVLIILGALMDGLRLDPRLRMVWLMLILGILGWPSIARLVRGQILSLREQEFMVATEAAGLRAGQRIFRHLLPGVVPQLIVSCTMSLGSTILTEATLSFLGLGVKFPFASWGNIMNDVANVHVLTSYPFVWIPAGVCLVLAVLGFNFAGDGLRDAFDPKMKR